MSCQINSDCIQASPVLDLVNDCFRFVTGFFEIINESAPHIYHSALPLSPRTSIVRTLYEGHALPMVRIAHGLPNSWEPSIAATRFSSPIDTAVWSPCSKFIAIAWGKSKATIEILDAVTLGRLTTLDFPLGRTRWLVFSPNAHLLTWFGEKPGKFISWEVQTGLLVSAISPDRRGTPLSATYSACETMFGVSSRNDRTFTISIYNVHSGTHIYSRSVEGQALDEIWTHDRRLRFATTESESITTWETGFTETDTPTEVESLPIPGDSHRPGHFLLHPTLSRLAFIAGGRVKVWGTQNSEFLLDSADVEWPRRMSLSIGGRFFACGTSGPEIHLWEESPSGYTPNGKLISNAGTSKPLISPCGESIIAFGESVIQLWRTTDPTSSSTALTRASQGNGNHFTLGFSPDGALAAVTRVGDETVTIMDLESGIPRLIIDTSMKVHGLGVSGNTVVVVGEGKIVTWSLPEGNDIPDPRATVNDSVRTVTFDHPPFPTFALRPTTSVSPNLNRIAILEGRGRMDSRLHLYDVPTGECLTFIPMGSEPSPWFTTDGSQVWCVADSGEAELWEIVEDGESSGSRLEHQDTTAHPPDGFPWRPSGGYSIEDDHRWVLNSSGKRLLWLPPHWLSEGWNRMWGGRFLALLDRELLEPVILELE